MNRLLTLGLAATAIALSSCSRMMNKQPGPVSAAEKESDAEAKMCEHMSKRNPAVQSYPTVTPETSLEQVKTANDELETAVREVEYAGKDINNPGVLEIQMAFQKLQNSVNSVPGGRTTVGEASDSVQANARELRQAWNQVYTKMQCGS
jgi:hypothetical protein